MTARSTSTAKPNCSATCWNISRCWPVATTRQARSSDPRRAATTGAILIPSGRVPMNTATVLREPMEEDCIRRPGESGQAELVPEVLERAAQAVRERDPGLPAQERARARDVGLPHARVVEGQRARDDAALRAGQRDDRLRQLADGELVGIADVDGVDLVRRDEAEEAVHEIGDVAEASRLAAVAEHGHVLVAQGLAEEGRDRAPVLDAHPRP